MAVWVRLCLLVLSANSMTGQSICNPCISRGELVVTLHDARVCTRSPWLHQSSVVLGEQASKMLFQLFYIRKFGAVLAIWP